MNQIKAYLYAKDDNYPDTKSDFGFLKEVFDKAGIETVRVQQLPKAAKAIVVVCGCDFYKKEYKLDNELSKIDKVMLFVTANETGQFQDNQISHRDIKFWMQSPFPKHESRFKFPIGAPEFLKTNLPEYAQKEYDVFYSGQINHGRREELAKVLPEVNDAVYYLTKGFMQGYDPKEYYNKFIKGRIAPAPAGNVTIDSFRFYEALELLCLPIGDIKNAIEQDFDFWDFVFDGKIDIAKTNDWNELPQIVDSLLNDYPQNMHLLVSWWIRYKRDFAIKILREYHAF
jgi:hypothetical protein